MHAPSSLSLLIVGLGEKKKTSSEKQKRDICRLFVYHATHAFLCDEQSAENASTLLEKSNTRFQSQAQVKKAFQGLG
jgi:hypothetical protein